MGFPLTQSFKTYHLLILNKESSMLNRKIVAVGFSALIFLSIGCSNTESNSVQEAPSETITEQIPADVMIRGHFKRSFEIHELEANGKIYYVSDPKQLLMKESNGIGQDGYYKAFDACVIGTTGSEGGYGPTGKYENEITVSEICV